MNEQTRPLEIAFMGWNLELSAYLLGRFADDNAEQIAQRRRERLTLIDGTTITILSPGRVRSGIDGRRYDQLILADDRRELIRAEAAREIEVVRYGATTKKEETMKVPFRTCRSCGCALDPGERCDCTRDTTAAPVSDRATVETARLTPPERAYRDRVVGIDLARGRDFTAAAYAPSQKR